MFDIVNPRRKAGKKMPIIYVIDPDLNVSIRDSFNPEAEPESVGFETREQFVALTAKWGTPKIVELWNSIAGTPRFADIRPVKKFENTASAQRRMWELLARFGAKSAARMAPSLFRKRTRQSQSPPPLSQRKIPP